MATSTLPPDADNDLYNDQSEFDQAFDEIVSDNPDLSEMGQEIGGEGGDEMLPSTYRQNTGGTNVSPVRSSSSSPLRGKKEKFDFGGGDKSNDKKPDKFDKRYRGANGNLPNNIWGNNKANKELQQRRAEEAGYKNPKEHQAAINKKNLERGTDEMSKKHGGATSTDSMPYAAGKIVKQLRKGDVEGARLSLGASKKLRRAALIGGGAVITIFVIVGFFIASIAANPFEFAKTVLTDKSIRRFVVNGAVGLGVPGAEQVKTVLEKAGLIYEIRSSNVAVAAPQPAKKPDPGTIDDILAHIDWQKAQWKYNNTTSCSYKFTFKPYVNYDDQTIHLIDKTYDKNGKEVPPDQANSAANECFMSGYPMFNLSVRATQARTTNKGSNAYLAYASDKDKVNQLSQDQADQALQKKTLERITDKQDQGPATTEQKVKQFADKIYEQIEQGKDPNTLDWDEIAKSVGLTFPTNDQDATQVAQSMCTYYTIFTNPDNTVKAIQTRHNVSVRNGLKFLSLAGSGAMYKNSNKETNYTANSIANWANGAGYSLQIGEGNKGEQTSAESLLNRAFIITPIEALRLNRTLSLGCSLTALANRPGGGIFGGFLDFIFKALGQAGQTVVLQTYQAFKSKVVADSSGIFEIGNPKNFGMKEILIASFKVSATGASTGTEAGPQNFNRQVMGVEQLTSDYMRSVGGRFLTDAERSELAIKVENNARLEQKNKSIIARLFDTSSPRSVVSQIASHNTSAQDTRSYLASITKSFSNPLQYLAEGSKQIAFVATGQNNTAFAAADDTSNYFKIELSGFSSQELSSVNLLDNAKAIEKLKKDIAENENDVRNKQMQYYDECIKKQGLTSKVLFTRIPIDNNVDNTKPEDQLKYIYIKKGFTLGGNGEDVIFTGSDPTKPDQVDVDSEFYKIYTCETMLTNENTIKMAKIDPDLAKRYRLYLYYKSQIELLRDLSQDKPPSYFYAGGGGSLGNSGQRNPLGFVWPVEGKTIFSRCGNGHGYPAIDIAWPNGEPRKIYAVADGKVAHVEPDSSNSGYGNYVILDNGNGIFTLYAHNEKVEVQEGQDIKQGDEIAIGDSTGHSTGNHLHFEVRKDSMNGPKQNPGDYLPDSPDGQDPKAFCETR